MEANTETLYISKDLSEKWNPQDTRAHISVSQHKELSPMIQVTEKSYNVLKPQKCQWYTSEVQRANSPNSHPGQKNTMLQRWMLSKEKIFPAFISCLIGALNRLKKVQLCRWESPTLPSPAIQILISPRHIFIDRSRKGV